MVTALRRLDAVGARAGAGHEGDRAPVVGTVFEVRDFLARNRVPYRWYAVTEPEGERLLAAAGISDGSCIPVVITPRGGAALAQRRRDGRERGSSSVHPAETFYDVIIMGAAPPAWPPRCTPPQGLRTVVVERTATGGQAGESARIENYLGFPGGVSAWPLERARRQAIKFGAELISARDVTAVEVRGAARVVRFADGGTIEAHSAILATGVTYRQLDAPGAAPLTGRGVLRCRLTEAVAVPGRTFTSLAAPTLLGRPPSTLPSEAAVTLLVRGRSLSESMSSYLITQIKRPPTSTSGQAPRSWRHTATPISKDSPCSTP